MKALLANLTPKRAIGISIDEREVVLSLMAFTPLGPHEVERRAERVGDAPIGQVLKRALAPLVSQKPWRRAPVAVGLPPLWAFFSTRPMIKAKNEGLSAQMVLHEVLRSSNVIIDDMEVDMIRARPFQHPVASVVACRKKILSPILEALDDCGVRPTRVEPGPCSLLRLLLAKGRPPRRSKTVLWILLARDEALAILTAGGLPLMWRSFAMEPGGEAKAVLSTFRSTSALCRYYGLETAIDVVRVHGRPDLAHLEETPEWPEMSAKAERHDGPSFDGGEVAFGAALGCGNFAGEGFNLARDLAPPVSPWDLLPWGQILVQSGVLAGATLLMGDVLRTLERSAAAIASECSHVESLKRGSDAQLRTDATSLGARVGAVQRYLESRVLWTDCIREFATRLPESMAATSIAGECRYEPKAKAKASQKRSFSVSVAVPTPGGGSIPPEVDGFLRSMRESTPLKRAFPSIEMGELRRAQSNANQSASASFTIVCKPKTEKPSSTPKAATK